MVVPLVETDAVYAMAGVEVNPERESARWDAWEKLSQVETDRFCDGCAYNMRLQVVRREPATGIPVCRCPECGRFHAVAGSEKPIRQLITRLPLLWAMLSLVFAALLFLLMGFGQFMMHVATIDLAWAYQRFPSSQYGYGYSYLQPIHSLSEEEFVLLMVTAGLSVIISAIGGVLAAIHFFHWTNRRTFFVYLAAPLLAATIIMFILRFEGPGPRETVLSVGAGYVLGHVLLQALGLLLGVTAGRAIARFVVRYVLPPRLRPPMAFLWTTDGLEQPRFKDDSSPGLPSATMQAD